MKIITSCMLLAFIGRVLTCYSGGGGGAKKKNNQDDDDGPDDPGLSDHWPAPRGYTKSDIKKWIDNMKKMQSQASSQQTNKPLDTHGWPQDWLNLGAAHTGQFPPPWAIINRDPGKPASCYLKPARGTCQAYVYRYAYNPYTGDCEKFVYSGCGGNSNNYYTKDRCSSSCKGPAKGTCVADEAAAVQLAVGESRHLSTIEEFKGNVSNSYESDNLNNFNFTAAEPEDLDTDEKKV